MKVLLPEIIFDHIRVATLRFVFKVEEGFRINGYMGSAWRGVIGTSLKNIFCSWKKKKCEDCIIRHSCAYFILYEKNSERSGFKTIPRPYIFYPISQTDAEYLMLEVTLLGEGVEFIPHLIVACEEAGKIGIGVKRYKFSLKGVFNKALNGQWIPLKTKEVDVGEISCLLTEWIINIFSSPAELPWKIRINSPLRLRKQKKYLKTPDWSWAFWSLARKLLFLNNLRGGEDLKKEDWLQLKDFFSNPGRIKNQTFWFDCHRYSSTQKKKIPMGGIMGNIYVLPPENREEIWWKWWNLASIFHLGKGTTMGLGKIDLLTDRKEE